MIENARCLAKAGKNVVYDSIVAVSELDDMRRLSDAGISRNNEETVVDTAIRELSRVSKAPQGRVIKLARFRTEGES